MLPARLEFLLALANSLAAKIPRTPTKKLFEKIFLELQKLLL